MRTFLAKQTVRFIGLYLFIRSSLNGNNCAYFLQNNVGSKLKILKKKSQISKDGICELSLRVCPVGECHTEAVMFESIKFFCVILR